jgi:predicted ATPase
VLTGGPGAGKTAVLELVRMAFCRHVLVLPEAASLVFGGGFPRVEALHWRQGAQRAIFRVQRELERAAESEDTAVVLCDRGTIDGMAFWPGDDDLLTSVGTTLDEELRRYDTVIHLRPPTAEGGYNHRNPLRRENAEEAGTVDRRIERAWARHPRQFVIEPSTHFLTKAVKAVQILRDELPECCRPDLGSLMPRG